MSKNIRSTTSESGVSLLQLVEIGYISNKVNGYKIKNVMSLDILNVIKMYIIKTLKKMSPVIANNI